MGFVRGAVPGSDHKPVIRSGRRRVKVRGRWLPCTLYEALTERDEIMRCKYCHGPVQALKESSNGARAHIEHLQRHTGCRFPVSTFSGAESEHPLALK